MLSNLDGISDEIAALCDREVTAARAGRYDHLDVVSPARRKAKDRQIHWADNLAARDCRNPKIGSWRSDRRSVDSLPVALLCPVCAKALPTEQRNLVAALAAQRAAAIVTRSSRPSSQELPVLDACLRLMNLGADSARWTSVLRAAAEAAEPDGWAAAQAEADWRALYGNEHRFGNEHRLPEVLREPAAGLPSSVVDAAWRTWNQLRNPDADLDEVAADAAEAALGGLEGVDLRASRISDLPETTKLDSRDFNSPRAYAEAVYLEAAEGRIADMITAWTIQHRERAAQLPRAAITVAVTAGDLTWVLDKVQVHRRAGSNTLVANLPASVALAEDLGVAKRFTGKSARAAVLPVTLDEDEIRLALDLWEPGSEDTIGDLVAAADAARALTADP